MHQCGYALIGANVADAGTMGCSWLRTVLSSNGIFFTLDPLSSDQGSAAVILVVILGGADNGVYIGICDGFQQPLFFVSGMAILPRLFHYIRSFSINWELLMSHRLSFICPIDAF